MLVDARKMFQDGGGLIGVFAKQLDHVAFVPCPAGRQLQFHQTGEINVSQPRAAGASTAKDAESWSERDWKRVPGVAPSGMMSTLMPDSL